MSELSQGGEQRPALERLDPEERAALCAALLSLCPKSSGETAINAGRVYYESVLAPALEKLSPEERKALEDVRTLYKRETANLFQDAVEAIEKGIKDLTDKGFPQPKTVEDWELLALIAEVPFEKIGSLTARHISAYCKAWAERQKLKHKIGKELTRDLTEDVSAKLLQAIAATATENTFQEAKAIILGQGTTNEKIEALIAILPILRNLPARGWASLLNVSRTAVQKTEWWKRNKQGERDRITDQRQSRLRERGRCFEA